MEDNGDFSQSPRCNEACEFVLAHVQLCTILVLNDRNHFLFQVYVVWHDYELNLIKIEFILLDARWKIQIHFHLKNVYCMVANTNVYKIDEWIGFFVHLYVVKDTNYLISLKLDHSQHI